MQQAGCHVEHVICKGVNAVNRTIFPPHQLSPSSVHLSGPHRLCAPSWRNHVRTLFLDSPVRRHTSRIDIPSRKCIRRILANMPTLINPDSLTRSPSRAVSLRGSVLDDKTPSRWVSLR